MKNKPPHIEYHLKNEEEDLMTVQNLSLCLFVITTGCHEGRVKACSQHMIGTELNWTLVTSMVALDLLELQKQFLQVGCFC